MRPPTQIDGSFRWDKDQIAWVQDSTGMIVTQQYIEAMNIPITSEARENQRKAIEDFRKVNLLASPLESGWHGMTSLEFTETIQSLVKEDPYHIETQDADGKWVDIAFSRLPLSDFVYLDLVKKEAQYWADRDNKLYRVRYRTASLSINPSNKSDR